MKIARFIFQNPKTIFDKCILYLPVINAKYSDYYQANPVLKNGKWEYPGGLQNVPRTRYLEFNVLGRIMSNTTQIFPYEYTTDFMKKVGDYVYVTINVSSSGYASLDITTPWNWFEYELSVKGSIVGRIDDIQKGTTGRWSNTEIRIKGIFYSRFKNVYFPFDLKAESNYSCLERVLQGKQRIWGREVCWIECNGLSGFIKEDKVYYGSSTSIKII